MNNSSDGVALSADGCNPAHEALQHELSMIHSTIESYESPAAALRALIDWHCAVEVDPAVKLLEIAKCPICDGGGAYYDNYGYFCQCQWCDEKSNLLAATSRLYEGVYAVAVDIEAALKNKNDGTEG